MGGRVRTLAGCEREAYAIANLVAKSEQGRAPAYPIHTDLRTFPFEAFADVDCLAICGGFPCQPFSVSGNRPIDHGEEDPRHLWPAIERGIRSARPDLLMFENVDGIASSKLYGEEETSVLQHVLAAMESMGYLAEAASVSAREIGGLPHNRRRWFIFGALADTIDSGGLRRCGDVERFCRETREIQEEGGEPAQEIRCGGSRPAKLGNHAWVARPSQAQYEWEYPRILVADTEGEQDGGDDQRGVRGLPDRSGQGEEGLDSMETQPLVGCDVDGVASGLGHPSTFVGAKREFLMKYRTAALRLLGNGVVPQQAERACHILAPRIAIRARELGLLTV